MQTTIIKVRRGRNGHKYSACCENGELIGNFNKLSEIRRRWERQIRRGEVVLVRELDKAPDMSKTEAAKSAIKSILLAYAGK